MVKVLAQQLRPQLEATVKHNDDPAGQTYSPDAKSAARRALKNKALAYLAALGDAAVTQQVLNRYGTATNMTDKISALAALIDSEGEMWWKLSGTYCAQDCVHAMQPVTCIALVL